VFKDSADSGCNQGLALTTRSMSAMATYRQQPARAHLLVQSVGLCVDPPGFSLLLNPPFCRVVKFANRLRRITHGNTSWRALLTRERVRCTLAVA